MGIMKKVLEQQSNRIQAFPKTWSGPFDIEVRQEGATTSINKSLSSSEMEQFNTEIKAWGAKVKASLPGSMCGLGIKGSLLKRSVKDLYGFDYGEIFRIAIAFRREGIFVHKGVGRGYKMQGGQVVKTSKSQGFNRQPKPWFNPVIEANIGELDQIIHSYIGAAIVNCTRIYIR